MESHVTPRYVCGNIYMERLTFIHHYTTTAKIDQYSWRMMILTDRAKIKKK